jgi:hypothetical protein
LRVRVQPLRIAAKRLHRLTALSFTTHGFLTTRFIKVRRARIYVIALLVAIGGSTPASEHPELSTVESSRSVIDYFVDTNALDASDAMLLESRRSLLTGMGIPVVRHDQEMRGRLPVSDHELRACEVRHIALRQLMYADADETEGLAERVTRIKTKLWIPEEEQTDLFQAAKMLMKEGRPQEPARRRVVEDVL